MREVVEFFELKMWFIGVPGILIPVDQIIETNKEIIKNQVELYQLSTEEVGKCILWALKEDNKLNVSEFKEACQKIKPSKEEQFIQTMKRTSPKQLLEDLSYVAKFSGDEQEFVDKVQKEFNLSSEMMNILIHYTFLNSNMSLSKELLKKTARHWKKKGITTIRQAMTLARLEKQNQKLPEKGQEEILYQKIVEAIDKGYTNEQLGFFVRNIINKQINSQKF